MGGVRSLHEERIPMDGPVIFAPSHFSMLDPPLISCGMRRQITFMSKRELFSVPVLGWLIRSLGAFPVSRGSGDKEAIKMAISLLNEGKALLMFPEGKRGYGKQMYPITSGILMLARKTGALVVPVGIHGTQIVLPIGKKFPKRHRMTINFGTPIDYKLMATELGESQAKTQFNLVLEASLIDLCKEMGLIILPSDKSESPVPSLSKSTQMDA